MLPCFGVSLDRVVSLCRARKLPREAKNTQTTRRSLFSWNRFKFLSTAITRSADRLNYCTKMASLDNFSSTVCFQRILRKGAAERTSPPALLATRIALMLIPLVHLQGMMSAKRGSLTYCYFRRPGPWKNAGNLGVMKAAAPDATSGVGCNCHVHTLARTRCAVIKAEFQLAPDVENNEVEISTTSNLHELRSVRACI